MNKKRRRLYQQLHQTPIAFYPIYLDLMGAASGGILLSQMMYWFGIQKKFFKTDEEFLRETHLTAWDLRAAKSAIKKKIRFIKVTREGMPARTYYKINWSLWEKDLVEYAGRVPHRSRLVETTKQVKRIPPTLPYIHKTTTKRLVESSIHPDLKNHPRWNRYARLLGQAIAKGRRREWNGQPIRGADEFRKLHTLEPKVSIKEIRDMVEWYSQKCALGNYLLLGRDHYIPVCGNGWTFRKKWDQLEGAKARDEKNEEIENGPKIKPKRVIKPTT